MRAIEHLTARGHPEIRATHRLTFEITRDKHLSKRGDCIIAVEATKAATDLSRDFLELARSPNSTIRVELQIGRFKELVVGKGTPLLTYRHPTDLVARRSLFTCDRTLMVSSSKAACDLSRRLVKLLRKPDHQVSIQLLAEADGPTAMSRHT